jgi:anti-sigma factor RsiW
MNCTDRQEQLHDWLDGELPPDAVASLEAHLATCEPCRREAGSLQALLAGANALPDAITPPRDLWPDIQARLQSPGVQDTSHRREPPWLRAVAASVLLVGVFAAGMLADRVMQRGVDLDVEIADDSGANGSSAELAGMDASLNAMERIPANLQSAAARQALPPAQVELVAGLRDGSGADTEAVMLRNLLIVNLGIRQVEQALEADPDNPELRDMLASLYAQENRLLRQAERMTSQGATRKRIGI